MSPPTFLSSGCNIDDQRFPSEAHLHAETVAEEGEENVEGIHGDAIARPRRDPAWRKVESMVAQSASGYFREASKWRGLGNHLQGMIEYHCPAVASN